MSDTLSMIIKHHDRDRYLLAQFLPPAERQAFLVLVAFNMELAQIREKVSEPMLGRIRLQWWREALDDLMQGTLRQHDVLEALAPIITHYTLSLTYIHRMIDARELDIEESPPATIKELERYLDGTAGALMRLAMEVTGEASAPALEAGSHAGQAWGYVGLLRALPYHAQQGKIFIPQEILEQYGLNPLSNDHTMHHEAVEGIATWMLEKAQYHLAESDKKSANISKMARNLLLSNIMVADYVSRLQKGSAKTQPEQITGPSPWTMVKMLWKHR